ncbi:MAG: DUF1007 family protein [bacterium]
MKTLIFILCTFLISSNFIYAHPHLFVDVDVSAIWENGKVSGFHHSWTFDRIFSSTMIPEFDADGNGKIDKDENKTAFSKGFSYSRRYNYFNSIKINGKRKKKIEIENFRAEIKKNQLLYEFFVPVGAEISNLENISLAVFDPTYYTSFKFENISEKGDKNKSCVLKKEKTLRHTISYGKVSMELLKIVCDSQKK